MYMIDTFLELLEFDSSVKRATRAITSNIGAEGDTSVEYVRQVGISNMRCQIGDV
jgi:hypothetical protein